MVTNVPNVQCAYTQEWHHVQHGRRETRHSLRMLPFQTLPIYPHEIKQNGVRTTPYLLLFNIFASFSIPMNYTYLCLSGIVVALWPLRATENLLRETGNPPCESGNPCVTGNRQTVCSRRDCHQLEFDLQGWGNIHFIIEFICQILGH